MEYYYDDFYEYELKACWLLYMAYEWIEYCMKKNNNRMFIVLSIMLI